jgi:Kae1-associated kinase Bud32
LGIESTAHTFGVGVVEKNETEDFSSSYKILADVKDVYKAQAGSGIHPREASRHHVDNCSKVLEQALDNARIRVSDIDLVAYSAGPGLGPCLRVGAVVARTLGSYYQRPVIPTNHAIGHIELGKFLCNLDDPLVLIVSGGHTALAAKVGRDWKIFGETLDLTLGQLIDQMGRFIGLSSPAGAQIEQLSLNGKIGSEGHDYLTLLPYTIKGNDVSYSGLLSAAKELYSEKKIGCELMCYILQEVAFSILAEATERALAFTDKTELLVTGGVAANQRLGAIMNSMCTSRGVTSGIIPRQYAGDCGSQIALAGFTFYQSAPNQTRPEQALVRQSWRIDQVTLQAEEPISQEPTMSPQFRPSIGAEASIELIVWHGISVIRKDRLPKAYRDKNLDAWLRRKRTREEAEILYRAKLMGVECPKLYFADPERTELYLEYVEGILLRDLELLHGVKTGDDSLLSDCYELLGKYAARLHNGNIIHGDLTTRNLIHSNNKKLVLIDFGLSFVSERTEDKAEDLHLLKQALRSITTERRAKAAFEIVLGGYRTEAGSKVTNRIQLQISEIERRGRYARVD